MRSSPSTTRPPKTALPSRWRPSPDHADPYRTRETITPCLTTNPSPPSDASSTTPSPAATSAPPSSSPRGRTTTCCNSRSSSTAATTARAAMARAAASSPKKARPASRGARASTKPRPRPASPAAGTGHRAHYIFPRNLVRPHRYPRWGRSFFVRPACAVDCAVVDSWLPRRGRKVAGHQVPAPPWQVPQGPSSQQPTTPPLVGC